MNGRHPFLVLSAAAFAAALAFGQDGPKGPPSGAPPPPGKNAPGADRLDLLGNPSVHLAKECGGKLGPFVGRIGALAEIKVPEGVWFVDQANAGKFMKKTGNPGDGILGIMVFPKTWMVFHFEDTGYVKDADKDKLDADQLLKDMQAGDEAGNQARKSQGLGEVFTDGWEEKPFYDPETKNLVWGLRVRGSRPDDFSINYDFRILGRRGVMECTLVGGGAEIAADKKLVRATLQKGFEFVAGNKYAEFQPGDKIAQYGLAALIAGGGVAAAAKLGLLAKFGAVLAKFGKLAAVVAVGLLAGIVKLFATIFGRRKKSGD